jgi:hypothetical protein
VAVVLAMTLAMRTTGLASPAFAHLQDWTILEDGETVGRIYESDGKPPEIRWFWSMHCSSNGDQES